MIMYDALKKRWPLVAGLTLAAALLVVGPASAAEAGEGEDVVIGAGEVIEDDYVFAGNSLTVDGVIQGDLVAAGNAITVNGTVEGDLIAGATSVVINGEVQDDAYVGTYALKLGQGAAIGDELMLGTFSLETGPDSSIGGDVHFGAFQALLEGSIKGNLRGGANGVQIEGSVGEDVELGVGEPGQEPSFDFSMFIPGAPRVPTVPSGLTVGRDASIGGDLDYTSVAEGEIPDGVVAGQVKFEHLVEEDGAEEKLVFQPTRPGEALAFLAGQFVLRLVRRFVTLALVGLLIVWQGRRALTDTVATFRQRPWASLGVGFLGYAGVIIALVIIPWVLLLLGIALGVVSLGGLTPAVVSFGALGWGGLLVSFVTAISWLAKIVLGVWLGQLVWAAIKPGGESLVPPLLVGVAITALLTAVPILGRVIGLAVALLGLGAIILTLRGRIRPAGEPSTARV